MPSVSWWEPLTSTSAACIHRYTSSRWPSTRTLSCAPLAWARASISASMDGGWGVPTMSKDGRGSGSRPNASTMSRIPFGRVTCPTNTSTPRSAGSPSSRRSAARSAGGRKRRRSAPPTIVRYRAVTRRVRENRSRVASESPIKPSASRSRIGSRGSRAVIRTSHTSFVLVPSFARPHVSASRGASGARRSIARSRSSVRMRRAARHTRGNVRGLMGCSGTWKTGQSRAVRWSVSAPGPGQIASGAMTRRSRCSMSSAILRWPPMRRCA